MAGPATDSDITALVARIPGRAGRARVLGELGGGTTNRNVVLEVDDERFVFRIAGNQTELLDIDRAVERSANEQAAALGLAPRVEAFLEPEGYLVTRFVAGTEPHSHGARRTGPACARSAGRSAPSTSPARSPAPSIAFACRSGTGTSRSRAASRSPRAYERAAARAIEIEAAFAASPEPRRPCHNDLLSANFIADGERLWLLDWEYAGMNDRYFDLGNLAANNELDADAEARLIVEYFGASTPRRAARAWPS